MDNVLIFGFILLVVPFIFIFLGVWYLVFPGLVILVWLAKRLLKILARPYILSFDIPITDAGLEQIAKLLEQTAKKVSIISLELEHCELCTDTGYAHLASLQYLRNLALQCCRQMSDVGLKHLSMLYKLVDLRISGFALMSLKDEIPAELLDKCENEDPLQEQTITERGIGYLTELKNLKTLALLDCTMNDACLEKIVKLSGLKSLKISESVCTDTGYQYLAELRSLEKLSLCDCRRMTDAGLESVTKLSKLEELFLRGCQNITDKGIEYITCLPRLKELVLGEVSLITLEGLKNILRLPCLTSLWLIGMSIDDEMLSVIASLKNLTFLGINCERISDDGMSKLANLKKLKELEIADLLAITDTGLMHLTKLKRLKRLDLYHAPKITKEAVNHLRSALAVQCCKIEARNCCMEEETSSGPNLYLAQKMPELEARARNCSSQHLFAWFDTLGLPEIKDKPFVQVLKKLYLFSIDRKYINDLDNKNIPKEIQEEFERKGITFSINPSVEVQNRGLWLIKDKKEYQVKLEINTLNIYQKSSPLIKGFLLKDEGATFTILPLGLYRRTFYRSDDPEEFAYTYKHVSLADWAHECLARLPHELEKLVNREHTDWYDRPEELEIFVLAKACSIQGMEKTAHDLFIQAFIWSNISGCNYQIPDFAEFLADRIGDIIYHDIISDFGNLAITYQEFLQILQKFLHSFAESRYVFEVMQHMKILTQMIAEESERKSRNNTEPMSLKERIDELIYQLQTQHGKEMGWSDIPSYDFFQDERGEKSPAYQLVKLGYDAVPQLIEAIEDKRFTRTPGSRDVLRVGDCVVSILETISGCTLYKRAWTQIIGDSYSFVFGESKRKIKQRAEKWWKEIQVQREKSP